jgi:GNAT superfamily N-acetyltransferase
MPDWTLRLATAADEHGLVRCIDRAYAIYANSVPDLPEVSEGLVEDITKIIVWVADLDAQIVGVLVHVRGADSLTLANVAVDPSQKGHGLGKTLMELATSEAARLGNSSLRLSTHIDMPENVAFYTYHGWHETGREGNKVHMCKSIKVP